MATNDNTKRLSPTALHMRLSEADRLSVDRLMSQLGVTDGVQFMRICIRSAEKEYLPSALAVQHIPIEPR